MTTVFRSPDTGMEQTLTDMRYCMYCKHYFAPVVAPYIGLSSRAYCFHSLSRDVVGEFRGPYEMRKMGALCGPGGALYERKPPEQPKPVQLKPKRWWHRFVTARRST